jgi:hypothetical protein
MNSLTHNIPRPLHTSNSFHFSEKAKDDTGGEGEKKDEKKADDTDAKVAAALKTERAKWDAEQAEAKKKADAEAAAKEAEKKGEWEAVAKTEREKREAAEAKLADTELQRRVDNAWTAYLNDDTRRAYVTGATKYARAQVKVDAKADDKAIETAVKAVVDEYIKDNPAQTKPGTPNAPKNRINPNEADVPPKSEKQQTVYDQPFAHLNTY